ncbi:MAG: NADH:ubiquinone reductase (Na(+)-transporting) subunit C [Paludibacteraceae bacterium]|nr:NADH:ubiquinone reductase (Na(+)-transporting) subunit C [Paludibacteraceae bacterium]
MAENEQKKGFNKNSNVYIIIYTIVIVAIVALLLSITSGVLKERQDKNIELDKKKQILSSMPAINLVGADASALYDQTIQQYCLLNEDGTLGETIDFNYELKEGDLPIYVANIEGETKYIIPLNGAGLWGAIWGYIALNEDKNTVYGVYFSHAGETPGLGAKIADKKFQTQFEGKHVMNEGIFASIAVMKKGQTAEGQDQVDAISGGTITSKGVETMLKDCLSQYSNFFNQGVAPAEEPVEEAVVEEEETINEEETL